MYYINFIFTDDQYIYRYTFDLLKIKYVTKNVGNVQPNIKYVQLNIKYYNYIYIFI